MQKAAKELGQLRAISHGDSGHPVVTKLDITRDLMGFFYAPGNWQALHGKLKEFLDATFGNSFSNNGNSFDSCFQFVGLRPRGRLYLRIKIYNKLLTLL